MIACTRYVIRRATVSNVKLGDTEAEAPGKSHRLLVGFDKHLLPALKIVRDADMKILGEQQFAANDKMTGQLFTKGSFLDMLLACNRVEIGWILRIDISDVKLFQVTGC